MHVLCVDADDDDRSATASALESAAFDVTVTESVGAAREIIGGTIPDAVVSEYGLPDGTGLELFAAVREHAPDATCVLYTRADFDDIDTDDYGDVVAEYLSKDDPDALTELTALLDLESDPVLQAAYPVPDDERDRIEALERYVEHPDDAGESIDRLTELATALFDVDSAAVGLIDAHHERFLSCHGAAFDTLDREASICTYAILDPDVTVVEDVAADPRFADNEGLLAAGVRFYAGAPLVTESGHAIGTFCLHAEEPRSFDDEQRHHLRLFAEEAMEQIEIRRRLRENDG